MKIKKSFIKEKIISNILLFVSLFLLLSYNYINNNINWNSFDQLIYSIQNTTGTSFYAIKNGLIFVLKYFTVILLTLKIFQIILKKYIFFKKTTLYLDINNKFNIKLYPISKYFISLFIFIITLFYIFNGLGIIKYIEYINSKSEIFENEYIDSKDINISFEEKRNLIHIYVESLENSAISKENGGLQDISYIPNLEEYAKNYTNFSNNNGIGGPYTTTGSTWTMGGLVSQTSGIPLKTGTTGGNDYSSQSFLSGVFNLGDILKDNGYDNYFLLGSDAIFAGREYYFKQHGDYEILDYKWAKEQKLIPEDYYEWWGYEDLKLFEYAKNKLEEISKDKPFNFTILTADTHFVDGYVDDSCPNEFDNKYANSYYCSDLKISDFLKWVQEQDFYKDTTIIITGDHLTMQQKFFDESNGYERTVYNMIMNEKKYENVNYKNRIFNTLDIFPTTIASIGGKIEGDRLGLGTNLYSNKPTLSEKYGRDYIEEELKKTSEFYNYNILKSDYIDLNKN